MLFTGQHQFSTYIRQNLLIAYLIILCNNNFFLSTESILLSHIPVHTIFSLIR